MGGSPKGKAANTQTDLDKLRLQAYVLHKPVVATMGPFKSNSRPNQGHRAAISLNNTAVSFLASGNLAEALASFEDAVKIMDLAECQKAATPNESAWNECEREFRLALFRLNHRASKCTMISKVSSSTCIPVCARTLCPILQVISSQCSPARIYDTLVTCANLDVSFPVVIDLLDDCENMGSSFEAAVVLYNLGVTYDAAAATMAASFHTVEYVTAPMILAKATMQTKAFDMFQWSSALLATLELESTRPHSPLLNSRLLLLQTAVTHSLINVSIASHRDSAYHGYCHVMSILLNLVGEQHNALPINEHHIAASA